MPKSLKKNVKQKSKNYKDDQKTKAEEQCEGQTVMRPAGKFNFVAEPYAHFLSTYYYLLVKQLEMFYLPILDGGRVSGRSVPSHVVKASQFGQCFV